MCFRVDCKQCGKYSWGGCGSHLVNLYASIDQGKHCMCKSWPGVVIPNQQHPTPTAANQQSLASASASGNRAARRCPVCCSVCWPARGRSSYV